MSLEPYEQLPRISSKGALVKRETECAVCRRKIEGRVPILLSLDGKSFPLCSSVCHAVFEEDRGRFTKEGRGGRQCISNRQED